MNHLILISRSKNSKPSLYPRGLKTLELPQPTDGIRSKSGRPVPQISITGSTQMSKINIGRNSTNRFTQQSKEVLCIKVKVASQTSLMGPSSVKKTTLISNKTQISLNLLTQRITRMISENYSFNIRGNNSDTTNILYTQMVLSYN